MIGFNKVFERFVASGGGLPRRTPQDTLRGAALVSELTLVSIFIPNPKRIGTVSAGPERPEV